MVLSRYQNSKQPNWPNVINIDAFGVYRETTRNTKKIAFGSRNKIMLHCHRTLHWQKHVASFRREHTNEKMCDYMKRFSSSFCVCVCVWWHDDDMRRNITKRNRNGMDLNQSPFVMAFVRMLMSYDRYRMMLIIIFVVTTTFSRRRSAPCVHATTLYE